MCGGLLESVVHPPASSQAGPETHAAAPGSEAIHLGSGTAGTQWEENPLVSSDRFATSQPLFVRN